MKAITMDELRQWTKVVKGQILAYNGDNTPFATPFLFNKGKAAQTWLLPAFILGADGKRDWFDAPGAINDVYRVVEVEVGRTRKKKDGSPGAPLPDLCLIQSQQGSQNVFYGLNPADVFAKFKLVASPTAFDDLTKTAEQKTKEILAANDWERSVRESAW